ncbi:hypothetical protein P3X46_012210 [Hevea brasiliensis]|uniref:Glabrous enhancer-binding protein-like DBD domain-containing protein n=1 Tax=Hevea brasiliensis TaxID=3981 RepID=A0ABQ9MBW3_HEVBR|nr:STOREKEEPER protein [Hevea brasiliensis]KAJ9176952.1 hypothetical protein P3X46_012210 [Hevea brasiliensis]
MAIKRVSENPPPASFEEEEEEEDDSTEENDSVVYEQNDVADVKEDDDEGPQESPVLNKSAVPATPPKSSSATESDSESTQPSLSPSAFTIKLHKRTSKPNKSVLKRPADSDIIAWERPSKKNKATGGGDEEEVKKGSVIQRLWSEDDEIAILNGLSQYKSEKGADPYADMGDFHEFIEKSLHVDVSKNQLIDKIRRLKKKYQNNLERGENGRDPVFSKPHDVKSFELSKKFWDGGKSNEKNDSVNRSGKVNSSNGGGGGGGGVTLALANQRKGNQLRPRKEMQAPNRQVKIEENHQVKGDEKMQEKGEDAEEELWEMYPFLSESLEMDCLSEGVKVILRQQMGMIEKGKLKELEDKWKRLKQAELELFVQRMELAHEQVKLSLDSIKSGES